MKKIKLSFTLLLLINSLCVISQSVKFSERDSLLSLELYDAGLKAARIGDFENAINNFNQIYELRKKIFGSNSIRLAGVLNNIGIQYKNLGNYDKAIEFFEQSEALYVKEYGNDSPALGVVYNNLGIIYSLVGDFSKGLEYYKNAFRILSIDSLRYIENFHISISPHLRSRWYDLIAKAYRNDGNNKLAEKYYLLAIESWTNLFGTSNIELADEYLAYSAFLISQKKYDQALVYSSKAKTIALKYYGKKSRSYAEVQSNFGDYYYMKNSEARQIDDFRFQRKKYLNEAISYYHDAIISLVDSFQTNDPFIDPPLNNVISDIPLVDEFKKKPRPMEKLPLIYLSELHF